MITRHALLTYTSRFMVMYRLAHIPCKLEIDPELRTQHWRVRKAACAAGPNNVLEVGLDEIGTLAQINSLGQFHPPFVILPTAFNRNQRSISLRSLQRVAEIASGDTQRNCISRARIEQPAGRNACREIQRKLLDAGIGCNRGGAEDTESAVTAAHPKWKHDLVEEPVIAPTSTLPRTGFEVGEGRMGVPAAELVIAQPCAGAGEPVEVLTDLAHCEEWAVERKIHAMVFV